MARAVCRAAVGLLLGLTLALMVARPSCAQPARRIALVVGNGAYQHLPELANPPNDANLIAGTLKELGFVLIGGAAQLNLDKSGFDRAVQSFGAALQQAEVGLFYYAGHGLQVQGTNWLVPVGANPTAPQDLDFQMVDAELVLKQMQFAKTRLNVMILDACRNNPFGGRGLRAAQGGLAEMRAPEGTLIAYATQPGNVARDGEGGNSPFSAALAVTLRQPGYDVFRLFNQVGLAVKRETGGDQQPWVSSSPIDGDFYFSGVAPGDVPRAPADPDLVFWQAIANSSNPSDYQAYLQQFPNGHFAPLARGRTQQAALVPLGRPPPVAVPPAPQQRTLGPSVFVAAVRAVNVVSARAELSFRDYVHQISADRGPTGRETGVTVISLDVETYRQDLDQLRQAIARSSGNGLLGVGYAELEETAESVRPLPPDRTGPAGADALIPFAAHYIETETALTAAVNEAKQYYEQQNYLDDGFAKGRAMHPRIMAAYQAFLSASNALRSVLRSLSASQREAYLNGLSPDIRAAHVAFLGNVAQDRRIIALLGASDIRRIDPAALKVEIDPAEQSLAALRPLLSKDPDVSERLYGLGGGGMAERYVALSDKFLAKAKYLWRSLRDKRPISPDNFTFGTQYESDIMFDFNNLVYDLDDLLVTASGMR